MSSDLASVPKGELVAKFQRMRSMVKNVKEETKEIAERGINATMTLSGGAASGVIRGWDPDGPMMVPGTEVPLDAGLAFVAIIAGVTGIAGKASDAACALGSGLGAGALSHYVAKTVSERDKS